MEHTSEHATLTRRAARAIEKKIYSGVFPPDSPLPSTRTLANQFKVSQRVILSALDILEAKNILVRQERKRVYVKARSLQDNAREILFFAYGNEIGVHGIYQAVNDMILNNKTQHKLDYFSRIISSSEPFTQKRFEQELARLDNLGFIDCALIYGIMDETTMKKCMKLPYPVIFLGECPDSGKLPENATMISPDSCGLLMTMAEYAIRKKYKTLALAYWENILRHRYEKNSFEKLTAYLEENKMPLKLYPVTGRNIEEVRRNFNQTAPQIMAELSPGTLLAAHNIHSDEFDNRTLLPEEKYKGIDLITLTIPTAGCRIKSMSRDYSDMQQQIIRCIDSCGKNNGTQHIVQTFHYKVQEEPVLNQEKRS